MPSRPGKEKLTLGQRYKLCKSKELSICGNPIRFVYPTIQLVYGPETEHEKVKSLSLRENIKVTLLFLRLLDLLKIKDKIDYIVIVRQERDSLSESSKMSVKLTT